MINFFHKKKLNKEILDYFGFGVRSYRELKKILNREVFTEQMAINIFNKYKGFFGTIIIDRYVSPHIIVTARKKALNKIKRKYDLTRPTNIRIQYNELELTNYETIKKIIGLLWQKIMKYFK